MSLPDALDTTIRVLELSALASAAAICYLAPTLARWRQNAVVAVWAAPYRNHAPTVYNAPSATPDAFLCPEPTNW